MKTSVILHGLHNEFSLDQMKACIELAEKYGGSFRHVVTGIQITGIEKEDKEQLISELPEGVTTVIHRGVNSLIACVGKGYCKNGQMETKELADYVERKHYGRKTSHKCKIGISGCGRNCPDAMVKDIAFTIFVDENCILSYKVILKSANYTVKSDILHKVNIRIPVYNQEQTSIFGDFYHLIKDFNPNVTPFSYSVEIIKHLKNDIVYDKFKIAEKFINLK
jgi:dissimilatory sulfite reductase (desulfoviridin) alpha/beta subunit